MYVYEYRGGGWAMGHVTIHIFKFICGRFAVINVCNTYYSKIQDIQCRLNRPVKVWRAAFITVCVKSVYTFKSMKNKRKKSAK